MTKYSLLRQSHPLIKKNLWPAWSRRDCQSPATCVACLVVWQAQNYEYHRAPNLPFKTVQTDTRSGWYVWVFDWIWLGLLVPHSSVPGVISQLIYSGLYYNHSYTMSYLYICNLNIHCFRTIPMISGSFSWTPFLLASSSIWRTKGFWKTAASAVERAFCSFRGRCPGRTLRHELNMNWM